MKHLSSTIIAALALGGLCLSSTSHAQGWVDQGYVRVAASIDVYTSFPDPQGQYAAYGTTSAFSKTASPGATAHANGVTTKDFVFMGPGTPVAKSIYEGAQVYGNITAAAPPRPPGNPTSTATTTLISHSLTGNQNYDTRDVQTVTLYFTVRTTTIHRTMSLDTQASDISAFACAMGSIEQ